VPAPQLTGDRFDTNETALGQGLKQLPSMVQVIETTLHDGDQRCFTG
jgi:hypothetical protein